MQRYGIIFAVVLIFGGRCLDGAPGAAPATLQHLTEQADVVVIGRITDGFVTPGNASFSLQIEQTLKGSLQPGQLINVRWNPTSPNRKAGPIGGEIVEPDTGLFYLRGDSPGTIWELVPALEGTITGLRLAYYALPPEGERSSATLPGDGPAEKALLLLLDALEAGSGLGRDTAPVSFIYELRLRRQAPAVRNAIERLASSQNGRLKDLALTIKLDGGDLEALRVFAEQASSAPTRTTSRAVQSHFTNHDPQATALLLAIATDGDQHIERRRCAAWALTRSRTIGAVAASAQLLNEDDHHLQAAGVTGVSSFANNISNETHQPEPGKWPYQTADTMTHSGYDPGRLATDPPRHLQFWRQWWEGNRMKIVGSETAQ